MEKSNELPPDVAAALASLATDAQITTVERLAGGVSADVSRVSFVAAGEISRIVVRRHRDVAGKPDRAERALREYALLQVLHARGVPVPRPRAFVSPQTLLLDWVEGDTVLPNEIPASRATFGARERATDPTAASLSVATAGLSVADELAATLAAIHAVGEAEGLPSLPLLTDPLPALREWLPHLPIDELAFTQLRSFSGSACLLHGDFWPGNVLWQAGRLVAVLDWEDAALGDPLSDVACARVELCCARDVALAERFTAAYARHAAIDMARLPWWDLFVSTAALQYMDDWGLPADVLAARKAMTRSSQQRALAALGAS